MRKPFYLFALPALLLIGTPAALLACGGAGGEGGDFTPAGQGQAPQAPAGTEGTDPTAESENAPSPAPTTLSEDVQEAAGQLEEQYNVDLRGEFNQEGLDQMAIMLSFYEGKPEYFDTLSYIEMEEVGTINATGGVGAFYNGGQRFIHVYGFSQQMPQYQSPAEVTQHELGHHFSLSNALGSDWRNRYEQAVMSGPDVSRYGTNGRPAEKLAEAWSKLLHRPGDPYFNPPTWNGATSQTVAVVREKIEVALDPANIAGE